MTIKNQEMSDTTCPVEGLLKIFAGKWKSHIFRLSVDGPLRFNTLLRQIEGSNKQSIAVALKDMEEQGILEKVIVTQKPLHIEYNLSEKGRAFVPIFQQLESTFF